MSIAPLGESTTLRKNLSLDFDNPSEQEAFQKPIITAGLQAPWVIVLAGGQGRRLGRLTTALHGEALPKQFSTLVGEHSLLQSTLLRARALTPWQRIVVVATGAQEALARQQTRALGPAALFVQAQDRGTAAAILLALTYIRRFNPRARVLVLPSDHYVARPAIFEDALAELVAPHALEHGLVLLGAQPDWPESDYGWIVPGRALTGRPPLLRKVVRFVEKPSPTVAAELMRRDGLWNTFVLAASAERLWQAYAQALPTETDHFASFSQHIATKLERTRLDDLYARLSPSDFSRDVITRATEVGVATAPACGWSDWGTPERVFESLAGTPQLERLQQRIGRKQAFAQLVWNA